MKALKNVMTSFALDVVMVLACCVFTADVSHAEFKSVAPSSQMQIQEKAPAPGTAAPALKGCPDLRISLHAVKNGNGSVTLFGTVSNVGGADYDMLSVAQIFMNLSYPPKTYNQVGVSEQLAEIAFTRVKRGASFPINCTFQIPDFAGWASAGVPGNAKRLFTLQVAKKNMAPFAAGEECGPDNNSKGIEVTYQEQTH